MNRTNISVLLISLFFVGVYFGLRNIPAAKCEFLHYEVTKVTEDGIEMCADGPAGFLDLEVLGFPTQLAMAYDQQADIIEGSVQVLSPKGELILPHELAITHTERIHMMLIHESYQDYHHLHPTPLGPTGEWTFSFQPRLPGNYEIYVECVPIKTRSQAITTGALVAENVEKPEILQSTLPDSIDVVWNFDAETVRKKRWNDFSVQVVDKGGNAVNLEKVMDAYAHVVAFLPGRIGFAHIHPIEDEATLVDNTAQVDFTFFTNEPGTYKLWAQIMIDGQMHYIPRDVEVI